MGIKKIKIMQDIPLEEGKSYMTKFQTKERFTVTKITVNKEGKQTSIKGIYENSPDLGECSISIDRIIHEKIEIGEKEVCDCCSTPLNEKHKGNKFHASSNDIR